MKIQFILVLSAVVLLISCQKSDMDGTGDGSELLLGAVTDGATTKATKPLTKGFQFRMYIFRQGDTDIDKLVTSRTYTISDEAGTPVLDAGQEPLRLSLDKYDTYIVGPLNGVDGYGNRVEIATASGVKCYIGNDVVSSYTPLSVVSGVNTLNPSPLSHMMSKVGYVVQRPSSATYTDLEVFEISVDNQPYEGDFEFNTSGGKVVASKNKVKLYSMTPNDISGNKTIFYAENYLFPQPSFNMLIRATYNAKVGSGGVSLYEQSGIITVALVAGQYNRFTSNLLTPTIMTWRPKLQPWNDNNFGTTSAYNGLLLELCGDDAPLSIGGVMYWPDRSGNGNNVKLVGSGIAYNSSGRYYYTNSDSGNYLEVPALGNQNNLLIELVTHSAAGIKSKVLGSLDNINIGLPYDNNDILLDWGPDASLDRVTVGYLPSDTKAMEKLSTWQFIRRVNSSNVTAEIYRNGVLLTSGTIRSRVMNLGVIKLLESNSSRVKLHAVRVYSNLLASSDLIKNSDADRELYGDISGAKVLVSPTTRIDIPNVGGVYKVKVTSNVPWKASSLINGVTINPSSGDATYEGEVQITIPSKTVAVQTYMPVNFSTIDQDRNVISTWTGVRQAGIEVSPTSQVVDPNGNSYIITLTANVPWVASTTAGGIYINPSSGNAMTNGQITITVSINLNIDRLIPIQFTTTNSGTKAIAQWIGSQKMGIPSGSYIPKSVLNSAGWTTFSGSVGLQVAGRGYKILPGTTTTEIADPANLQWKTSRTSTSGTSVYLGYGAYNTSAMLLAGAAAQPAAAYCVSMGNDWYLPSAEELSLIYNYQGYLGASYKFVATHYWSSTQNDASGAYIVNFASSGSYFGNYKDNISSVRCVRNL